MITKYFKNKNHERNYHIIQLRCMAHMGYPAAEGRFYFPPQTKKIFTGIETQQVVVE
jgi:hypothetical protein